VRGSVRKRSRNRPEMTNQNHHAIFRRVVIAAIPCGSQT
jgi:hypothetical protein